MSIPIATHPLLGRALRIHLNATQMRWEARPGNPNSYGEGADVYFRTDFVLDADFPVNQAKTSFNLINQIHQANDEGTGPPVGFNVYKGIMEVRGTSADGLTTYKLNLGPVKTETKYKLVYRVKFSTDPAKTLLGVWLNDQVVAPVAPVSVATLQGGDSYWKGATAYCNPELSPFTVWQNAHRVGTTYASVN